LDPGGIWFIRKRYAMLNISPQYVTGNMRAEVKVPHWAGRIHRVMSREQRAKSKDHGL